MTQTFKPLSNNYATPLKEPSSVCVHPDIVGHEKKEVASLTPQPIFLPFP